MGSNHNSKDITNVDLYPLSELTQPAAVELTLFSSSRSELREVTTANSDKPLKWICLQWLQRNNPHERMKHNWINPLIAVISTPPLLLPHYYFHNLLQITSCYRSPWNFQSPLTFLKSGRSWFNVLLSSSWRTARDKTSRSGVPTEHKSSSFPWNWQDYINSSPWLSL